MLRMCLCNKMYNTDTKLVVIVLFCEWRIAYEAVRARSERALRRKHVCERTRLLCSEVLGAGKLADAQAVKHFTRVVHNRSEKGVNLGGKRANKNWNDNKNDNKNININTNIIIYTQICLSYFNVVLMSFLR